MPDEILIKIASDLGEIKGEITGMHNHLKRINGRLDNHDTDVDELKRERDKRMGMFIAIGSVVTFVINIVWNGWDKVIEFLKR